MGKFRKILRNNSVHFSLALLAMSLEIDDVRAWLLELHQVEAAALLSEAEFDYTYIDTAFRLEAMNDETDILELGIRVPPRTYRSLAMQKAQVEQIEAAVSELT